nr:hypothetical protein [Streptomyces sp. NTH33]
MPNGEQSMPSWPAAVVAHSRPHRGLGLDRRVRGDAHRLRTTGDRVTTLPDHTTVLLLGLRTLDRLTGQQPGVAGLDDRHPARHLPDDDLDVLVVDRHTLRVADLPDLADRQTGTLRVRAARPAAAVVRPA